MKHLYSLFTGIAAILFFHQTSVAQDEKKITILSGFEMGIGGGYTSFAPSSFTSINSALQGKGYAPAANGFTMESLDFIHLYSHNLYVGLGIDFLNKRNNSMDSSRTTATGNAFKMNIGYVVLQGKKCIFYPAIGFSAGKINVHSHTSTSAGDINDVSASNTFTSIDASLNWDIVPGKIPERTEYLSPYPKGKYFSGVLHISVGATYTPVNTFWNDNNIDIYNKVSNNVNFKTDVIGINNSAGISTVYVKLQYSFGMLYHKISKT